MPLNIWKAQVHTRPFPPGCWNEIPGLYSFKLHLLDTSLTFTALRLAGRFVGDWLYKEEYYSTVALNRRLLDVLKLLNTVILSPMGNMVAGI